MNKKINKLSSTLIKLLYSKDIEKFNSSLEDSDVHQRDRNERTLLHHAVLLKNEKAVKILLSKKADVNAKDKIEWTPLHYAVQVHDVMIAKNLLDSGADSNQVDLYGNSVLWRAVFESKGRGEMISLLLKYNARPDLENKRGISPIMLAKTIANYDLVKYFNV
jgi:ankyrin repeat protein